nr:acetate--CoA ligase family protein [Caldilineaceae bacterium]
TLQQLNRLLPPNWSHGNPVDIIGDAPPERYLQTLRVLLDDPGADAVLFLHSPSAIVPSEEIARVLAPVMAATQRNVLTCWLGGESTPPARHICASAGIPTYDSPEDAIAAFLQMVNYRRLGALVREESLPAAPPTPPSQVQAARAVIKTVLDTGREFLTEPEAKHVLAAYGIPTVATRFAGTADECAALAAELGFPLALKIVSPEISHKSEAGGVVLDLKTPAEVRAAALAMQQRVCATRPAATVIGFSVQTMVRRPRAQELILGVTNDPIFGPVILFGQGGVAVEVIADRAVALPPLDRELASELVARTRVARLLAGYRNQPPADLEAIYTTLLQVAQMVADLPELCELDINPLLADEQGVLALDARLRVRRVERCKRKLNNS